MAHRPLTAQETAYLAQVFGGTVDYAKVTLHYDKGLATAGEFSARTVGNNIYLNDKFLNQGGSLNYHGMRTLVHETGHVYQYQHNGMSYVADSLWHQLKGWAVHNDRGLAYKYMSDALEHKPLQALHSEQVAQIFQDWNDEVHSGRILQKWVASDRTPSDAREALDGLRAHGWKFPSDVADPDKILSDAHDTNQQALALLKPYVEQLSPDAVTHNRDLLPQAVDHPTTHPTNGAFPSAGGKTLALTEKSLAATVHLGSSAASNPKPDKMTTDLGPTPMDLKDHLPKATGDRGELVSGDADKALWPDKHPSAARDHLHSESSHVKLSGEVAGLDANDH